MRLKEFIARSGGVITAIALLGSMMTMAGAVPDLGSDRNLSVGKDGFNCSICGSLFLIDSDYDDSGKTYQEYYAVGDILNLTNSSRTYYNRDSQDLKVAFYNSNPICQSCLEAKIAEYKAANSGTISTPGSGSTPVTLTAAASTFTVTVPTSIPLVVGANSKVTSPSDVKIINNSAGPVKVTAIAMNDGAWTMTDYNDGDRSKLAAEKVGSNKLGLSLTAGGNTVASSKNGSQSPAVDSTKWRITGKNTGNNELPIAVGAIASAVSTKIENAVTAANVVFTVAWDK